MTYTIYEKTILNVKISELTISDLFYQIKSNIIENNKMYIAYANIHTINLAQINKRFMVILKNSDFVFCDGFGVDLASRILYGKKLERFTPPDWVPDLCELCQKEGFSIFFLGSKEYNVNKAAEKIKQKYPNLIISGTHYGFFNKSKQSIENQNVINKINSIQTNILFVGFGMPLQEYWIEENFTELQVNIIIPVGAAIDYLAGTTKRAPKWMTDHGLEWLGRLIIEPKRLWKRYIIGLPLFFFRVFIQKLSLSKIGKKDLG